MMTVKLTEGAIPMIINGEIPANGVKPLLQVMDIRNVQMQTASTGERYRILLSDGSFHQQGMLGTQRNELVKSQQLQRGSIIILKEFVMNLVRDRPIIIVLDVDVIHQQYDIIGEARPCPVKPSSEHLTSNSAAPMQSFNQPPTTMGNPHQTFTGTSVAGTAARPNFTANSPIYPPQQGHNAGLHSYGNPSSNFTNAPSMHSRTDSVTPISRPPANSYMRPVQPTYNQQQTPMHMNRGPTANREAPPRSIPISALNPYQGKWTIKARVTAKAGVRHYNNAKGDGKVFSFDLLDAHGGEIRTTCFNAVVDQFYDQLEVGKVYFISKGSLKPAQKAFNHLKNEYEITLDNTSTIQPCIDDDKSIPPQQYHFRQIAEIEGLDNNTILDIIGVVSSINPSSTVNTKNGETLKRTLELKDMSGRSVMVTLWGNFCNTEGQKLQNLCDSGVFPILAVKSVRVNEFNGKSVGTISTSQLIIEPDIPEARKLREWFDNAGRNAPSVSLSNSTTMRTDVRKVISQIKDEKIGTSEKPDYITISATIRYVNVDNFYYTACPLMTGGRACNKKVTNNGDGKWRCDKCDQSVDECDYRYILQLQLHDHTGLLYATAFQEAGEVILGVSAKELYNMKHEEQEEERFTEIVRNATCAKYNFLVKVKEETYNDDPRVKSIVVKAEKIKFSTDTSFFLDLLKKDDPTSVGPNVGPSIGSIRESAPFSGYTGNTSGVGLQSGFPPANQTGQYGNQYGGSASRLGTSCNSCGGAGHNSSDCPSVVNASSGRFNSMMSSGGGNNGVSGDCYKCHQPGHWARDCPGVNNVNPAYGGGNVGPGRYGSASGQFVGSY